MTNKEKLQQAVQGVIRIGDSEIGDNPEMVAAAVTDVLDAFAKLLAEYIGAR